MTWWTWLAVGIGMLAASWALLVFLAARLPDGALKELAGLLPACVTTARTLRKDPQVPRRATIAMGIAGLWVLSPIDLIPEFLPVIGPLDDVVVVALAFRYAARQVRRQVCSTPGPRTPPSSSDCSDQPATDRSAGSGHNAIGRPRTSMDTASKSVHSSVRPPTSVAYISGAPRYTSTAVTPSGQI